MCRGAVSAFRCHRRTRDLSIDPFLLWQLPQKEGVFVMKKLSVRMVVYLGLLTALEIVLSRFLSINAWNIRIGFSFIPIAVAAMLFGPVPAGVVAALADIVGAILFPTPGGGPFFPGYTLTAFLTGAVLGVFLYRKRTPLRILAAVLVNQMILSLLLNTFWISFTNGVPYLPQLLTRLIQTAILIPVQFAVIGLMAQMLIPRIRKVSA